MTLSVIAGYADIIAAFGVILSLAFLAYELRMTRKQSDLANWRDLLQSLIDYKGITNDLAFSEFIDRANQDYSALTSAEKRSYGLYLEQGVHIFGNFMKHNDTVPQKLLGLEKAVDNLMLDLLSTKGAREWWVESKPKGRFMPQTYVFVDRVLAKIDKEAVRTD